MNSKPIKLALVPTLPGKENVVVALKALLERAEAGEITGLLFMTQEENYFQNGKVNLSYTEAIFMAARFLHINNTGWDNL